MYCATSVCSNSSALPEIGWGLGLGGGGSNIMIFEIKGGFEEGGGGVCISLKGNHSMTLNFHKMKKNLPWYANHSQKQFLLRHQNFIKDHNTLVGKFWFQRIQKNKNPIYIYSTFH